MVICFIYINGLTRGEGSDSPHLTTDQDARASKPSLYNRKQRKKNEKRSRKEVRREGGKDCRGKEEEKEKEKRG